MKTDPWYLSKRNYATLIMVIIAGASLFNIDLGKDFEGQMETFLTAGGAIVGIIINILSKVRSVQKDEATKD
jgi:hypothetical protein